VRRPRCGQPYQPPSEQGISVPFARNDVQRALGSALVLEHHPKGTAAWHLKLHPATDARYLPVQRQHPLRPARHHAGRCTKKLDKARFANEKLPPNIKAFVPMRSDNATCPEWRNIDVGTSHRGGTLQILHVSEMGKSAQRHRHAAAKLEQVRSARCTPARPSS
jgi:hypothetical protein